MTRIAATPVKRSITWELDTPAGFTLQADGVKPVEFIPDRLEARTFHGTSEGTRITLTAAGAVLRNDGTIGKAIRTLSWRLDDAPQWARTIYQQEVAQ